MNKSSFISQRNSTFDSRYKFTAKELDNETQYTYFGARYYDSDLSVFISVDRFTGKYPSLSPYHYCVNNPINLIDINGDSIRIHYGGFLGIGKKEATYKNGDYYNNKGEKIETNNRFFNAVKSSINNISEGIEGSKMIDELAKSEHDFTIKRYFGGYDNGYFEPYNTGNSENEGVGSGGNIYVSIRGYDPLKIRLSHEMGHSIASNRGISNNNIWFYYFNTPVYNDEQIAMHYENLIRAESGLPLRRFYDQNSQRGRAVVGIDESTFRPGYNYYGGKINIIPSSLKVLIFR